MQVNKLVSVIIPVFNGRKFILDAINSALNQSYPFIEVIIVDDGSEDGSLELINNSYRNDPRVKILTHPNNQNLGVSISRGLGIRNSNGTFIAFLDADDIFYPEKIKIQVEFLIKYPEAVLCHSAADNIYDSDKDSQVFKNKFSIGEHDLVYKFFGRIDFLEKNPICNSSVMVRKKLILETMPVFTQLFQYEDWLTWVLLSFHGKFVYITAPLIQYRYHSSSATASLVKNQLKQDYSYLEFLLSLVAQLSNSNCYKKHSSIISEKLIQTLCRITSNYSANIHVNDYSKSLIVDLLKNTANGGESGLIRCEKELIAINKRFKLYEALLLLPFLRKVKRVLNKLFE